MFDDFSRASPNAWSRHEEPLHPLYSAGGFTIVPCFGILGDFPMSEEQVGAPELGSYEKETLLCTIYPEYGNLI